MVEAKRTLVKSGPELWAELSDPAALARHLEPFGAVRLVHADAETSVAWEGERARGQVTLEPSGFGTRVTLRAEATAAPPPARPAPPPPPSPAAAPPPGGDPRRKRSLWARMLHRRRAGAPAPPPAPAAVPVVAPPRPVPAMPDDVALAALTDVLDALGRAHHRPFSRA